MKKKRVQEYTPDPLFPIIGRVGNKVGVVRNGKYYTRDVGNMNGERYKTDKAFAGSRRANREFGAAGTLSATVRHPMYEAVSAVSESTIHSRLTTALMKTFQPIPGTRGKRKLNITDTIHHLEDFRFTRNRNTQFLYGYTRIENQPVIQKPKIKFTHHYRLYGKYKYPGYATHVRSTLILTAISDLKLDTTKHRDPKYKPIMALHGQERILHGPWISISELERSQTNQTNEWQPDQAFPEAVHAGCAIMATIAIEVAEFNPETKEEHYNRYLSLQIVFARKIPANIIEIREKAAQKPKEKDLKPEITPKQNHQNSQTIAPEHIKYPNYNPPERLPAIPSEHPPNDSS